jgi:hypothetical protein
MDADLRKRFAQCVDESTLRRTFENRYGRGWQRKLGEVLDVPETTINGWFREERFPALAKLAFGVLLSRARPAQRWVPLRLGTGYAVVDTEGPVARTVAENIPTLSDAVLIAAAPLLEEACGDAWVMLDDARGSNIAGEVFGECADRLRAALDAAECEQSSEATKTSDGDGVHEARQQADAAAGNEAS